jgi:hypothetical protein
MSLSVPNPVGCVMFLIMSFTVHDFFGKNVLLVSFSHFISLILLLAIFLWYLILEILGLQGT